jgi:hypothetical protein
MDLEEFREELAKAGLEHTSASALERPPCLRVFEYLYLGPRRREMPVGVPAIAGTAAHDGIQGVVCDGTDIEDALAEASSHIRSHKPISDLDELKTNQYVEDVELVINNGVEALAPYAGMNMWPEERITLTRKELALPMIGFVDIGSDDVIIELKTKWSPLGPPKKDLTRSFRKVKLPTRPDEAHVRQVAVYWAATGKMPILIYITKEGSVTFTADNCADLQTKSLLRRFNQLLHNAIVWENLLSISTDPKVLAMYIQPAWEDFRYRFMSDEFLKEARELYSV